MEEFSQRIEFSTEFFDTYAEAHRQRPLTFHYPAAVHQIAIWHPRRFKDRFAPYLAEVFKSFSHLEPQWRREDDEAARTGPLSDGEIVELSRGLRNMFSWSPTNHKSERLVFDFRDLRFERVFWRLEVHREFIAVMVQVGLNLVRVQDDLVVRAFAPATPNEPTSVFEQRVGVQERVSDCLFECEADPAGLELRVRALMIELNRRVARWSKTHAKEKGTPPRIFASFYGCVLPWTAFAAPGKNVPAPHFPDVDANGLEPGASTTAGLGATARFMDAIWEDLSGDFLNRNRDDVEQKAQSVVACHLQHGHAIYISSLGARKDRKDESPLHYLLLYQDAPDQGAGRPSGALTCDPGLLSSWRLSRLVGRLHDLGLTRLALLRRAKEMKNFAQYLSHVESELQRYDENGVKRAAGREPFTDHNVDALREDLFNRSEQFEESIINRSKQAGFYFESLKVSVEDLGVVPIPRYQSYDKFLRRRLYGTMAEISDLAHRYQAVLKSMNTLYQFRTTKRIEKLTQALQDEAEQAKAVQGQLRELQIVAGLIALGALLYYVADAAERASSDGFNDRYGELMWYSVGGVLFVLFFGLLLWGAVGLLKLSLRKGRRIGRKRH